MVVNFWASWCIPCKGEAPALQKTYEQYKSQGLVVLGIDAQDFRLDAKQFAKRYGLTYPIAYDGKGSTLGRWGVTGFPETFFVDRSGRLSASAFREGSTSSATERPTPRASGSRSRASDTRSRGRRSGDRTCARGAPREDRRGRRNLEAEIVCPTCKTTLDQSNSPIATRMKAFIRAKIATGASSEAMSGCVLVLLDSAYC